MTLQLTVRSLTGLPLYVQVSSSATVLELKAALKEKDSSLLPHLQRLVGGPKRVRLKDSGKLSDYDIKNGAILSLVILPPFLVYVQGADGRKHTVTVKSSEPETSTVSGLYEVVAGAVGHSLKDYQLLLQGKPVPEKRHGRSLTLSDCGILKEATVVVTRIGLVIDISNPLVDVCFLVDCTGSMRDYIEAVKRSITDLRSSLVQEYKECDLFFSFVRYTDYDQPAHSRTSVLNFTSNASVFESFVGTIRARGGGGDGPEDVMGGLHAVFHQLNWRVSSNKVLVHIADYPCHGNRYHKSNFPETDSYPAGDPSGISHEPLMQKMVDLDVQYWFGYIYKKYTDKMIDVFNNTLNIKSRQQLMIRQFDATQPCEVGLAVQRSVAASVYGSEAAKQGSVQPFNLELTLPDWNNPNILEQTGIKTLPAPNTMLADLQKEDLALGKPSISIAFKIALNPFADGSECLVYHASDLTHGRRIVLKKYKRTNPDHNSLDSYMKELVVRCTAATYAREFNADRCKPAGTCSVEFTNLDIVQGQYGDVYMLEPFLEGRIVKYNNNGGVVAANHPGSDVLQAFSHYTWVKSGKTLLVCDLQGYKIDHLSKVLLTDPAIHSRGTPGKYGSMDGGIDGIKRFFQTHICSSICSSMKVNGNCI